MLAGNVVRPNRRRTRGTHASHSPLGFRDAGKKRRTEGCVPAPARLNEVAAGRRHACIGAVA
jgi:hypothetical protein